LTYFPLLDDQNVAPVNCCFYKMVGGWWWLEHWWNVWNNDG
jgi:hypothetical protein